MMNTFFARIVMVNTYSFFPPTHCRYLPGETSFLPKDEEQHSRAEIKDKENAIRELGLLPAVLFSYLCNVNLHY
jgi:hypothetical protein